MLKKTLFLAIFLCAMPLFAEIVVLENGKSIKAASYEVQGNSIQINLNDRGQMVIPIDWVSEIRPSPPEPKPVAQQQPPVVTRAENQQITLNFAFADVVYPVSMKYGVDWKLVAAVMQVESNGNPRAVSPKGARGLMQLMPATASLYDVKLSNIHDPDKNVEAGVRHLKMLLSRYNGRLDLVAAAYNAGEGAVARYKGIPPYSETQNYVKKVLRLYNSLLSTAI